MRVEFLRDRAKLFALRIINVAASLPKSGPAQVLGHQLLRSGTSVAANLREASRARSNAEVISKLGIVEQELDETMLWLELLIEAKLVAAAKLQPLHSEADELLRLVITCIKTFKRHK